MVFDRMGSDKRTLMRLSLVCGTWASLSQRRLFANIMRTRRSRGTPKSLALFLSVTPKVAAYARSLTIDGCTDEISVSVLKSIISHLPSLCTMRLRLLTIHGATDAQPDPPLPGHARHLALLEWHDCTTTDETMCAILGCFDSIAQVVLSDPLHHLTCSPCSSSEAISHRHLSIEHLSVRYFKTVAISSLERQLRSMASVRSSDILTFGDVREDLGVGLRAMTSLQHLHLLWRLGTDEVQSESYALHHELGVVLMSPHRSGTSPTDPMRISGHPPAHAARSDLRRPGCRGMAPPVSERGGPAPSFRLARRAPGVGDTPELEYVQVEAHEFRSNHRPRP